MVTLSVEENKLLLEVVGWDKLWALKSRLEIPLEHIKNIHTESHLPMGWFDGIKMGGTAIPNAFRAGTFYQQGEWIFWDIRNPEKAIVIELADERYAKLILEVEDPYAVIAIVEAALAQHRANVAAAYAELKNP